MAKKSGKKGKKGGRGEKEDMEDKPVTKKPEKVKQKKPRADGDPMYNEIDDFANKREKISFKKGDMGASSEEEVDSMDDDEFDPAMHEADSDDDDDNDEQVQQPFYEDDQEAYEEKRKRDIASEQNMTKAWGKKKSAYYGADTEEFELLQADEDDAEIEEREAVSQQKAIAEDFDEDDMDIGEMLAVVSKENAKTGIKDKKASKKRGKQVAEKDLLSVLNTDLDSIIVGNNVEKIDKGVSQMTTKQKREFLKTDAPELLLLLEDIQPIIEEVQGHIQPLLQQAKENKLATSKGLSFLELKYHLLLTYCTNICFYLLLKAQGKRVKDHPVINQLATIRTILDKTKSMDQKLKYQVEKLLKLTTSGPQGQSNDPLSYRPDPNKLVSKQDDDFSGDEDDQVYKPARLATVEFTANEKETIKEREKKEKARLKANASSFVKEIREELFDKPEERENIGGIRRDNDDIEKQAYEEEYMVRLMESKADKKKRKKQERISAMDDFDDFGDLSAMTESFMDKELGGEITGGKKSKIDELLEKAKSKRKSPVFEDDFDDDFDDANEFYNETDKSNKKKRVDHEESYPKPEWKMGADKELLEDGDRREAGNRIVKNRGLTRPRPREKRNPRVAHRIKYGKALERRKSQVQEYKGKTAGYGGEATGIKTGLIKSTRLIDKGQ